MLYVFKGGDLLSLKNKKQPCLMVGVLNDPDSEKKTAVRLAVAPFNHSATGATAARTRGGIEVPSGSPFSPATVPFTLESLLFTRRPIVIFFL